VEPPLLGVEHPDPVLLFGERDQVTEDGKGANDVLGLGHVQPSNERDELLPRPVGVAGPVLHHQAADLLLHPVERLARLAPDDTTQHPAESPDVGAEDAVCLVIECVLHGLHVPGLCPAR